MRADFGQHRHAHKHRKTRHEYGERDKTPAEREELMRGLTPISYDFLAKVLVSTHEQITGKMRWAGSCTQALG